MTKVFVYGTLKEGHGNNKRLLGNSQLIEKDVVLSGYEMFNCGSFPMVLRGPRDSQIKGEIYLVDSDTLEELDFLEGVSSGLYERVMYADDTFIYLGGKTLGSYGFRKIETGVWL